MPTFTIDEHAPILVEFKPAAGVVRTALTPQDLTALSEKAIANAMNTIHGMARRVNDTISAIRLSERPSKVEVDFGLVLTAEAGALIASASTAASFNVKLTWERQAPPASKPEMD